MADPWDLERCDEGKARSLAAALGAPPLLGRVLLARGVGDVDDALRFLEPRLASLPSPEAMAGVDAAAERLVRGLRGKERIAVFGDYDADGLTATALAVLALGRLGGEVRPWVASRFSGGYGLAEEAVSEAAEDGRTLLLVLDCGTSDHEALARARALGMDAIVVDHHPPTGPLPEVSALVNPHQAGCGFGDRDLAAVGLAFYLMGVLRTRLEARLDLKGLLDLVAVGTIADVAPLRGANRVLVRHGLERLSASPRPGLAALRALGRGGGRASAWTVGYQIAPRINAAGRLGRADTALRLLLTEDAGEAASLAARLDDLSRQRRAVEDAIFAAALPEARRQADAGRAAVVVAGEGWSVGVVGIVAARLVEALDRPAAVVALEGGQGRGSARAPAGVDLHAALARSSRHLLRYGGHAGAAGFSIAAEELEAFGERLSVVVAEGASAEGRGGVRLEGVLGPAELTLHVADWLERLGPFGAGNPEPLFLVRRGRVVRADERQGGHLSLVLDLAGKRARAFAPRMAARWPRGVAEVDLAVGLRRDDYRGDAVELRVAEVRPS